MSQAIAISSYCLFAIGLLWAIYLNPEFWKGTGTTRSTSEAEFGTKVAKGPSKQWVDCDLLCNSAAGLGAGEVPKRPPPYIFPEVTWNLLDQGTS